MVVVKKYSWLLILILGVASALLLYFFKTGDPEHAIGLLSGILALGLSLYSDKGAFFKNPKKKNSEKAAKESLSDKEERADKKGRIVKRFRRLMVILLICFFLLFIGIAIISQIVKN